MWSEMHLPSTWVQTAQMEPHIPFPEIAYLKCFIINIVYRIYLITLRKGFWSPMAGWGQGPQEGCDVGHKDGQKQPWTYCTVDPPFCFLCSVECWGSEVINNKWKGLAERGGKRQEAGERYRGGRRAGNRHWALGKQNVPHQRTGVKAQICVCMCVCVCVFNVYARVRGVT